jgi:hypothetical protein
MTGPAPRAGSFAIDPWDPDYGMAFGGGEPDDRTLAESTAELDLDLEVPAGEWQPVTPGTAARPPGTLLFLDGVRRIEARVWIQGDKPQPYGGIAASYAAGLVCCDGAAHIAGVSVQRGLFTTYAGAPGITTRHTSYPARVAKEGERGGGRGDAAAGGGPDPLSLALQQSLTDTEVQLAMAFRAEHPADDDLLVVDGPLRGRTHLDRVVGYIKTHHASYLPAEQAAVVPRLRPGQRTPAFGMGTSWRRSSWYLQLPGTPGVPWSGVVRLECSADLPTPEVTALADLTARLLPGFASTPHKDPRAPQNLVPIGGLERELRRRLGDQQLLYRSLRAAAVTQPAG